VKRLLKFVAIAILGLILCLKFHSLPQAQAQLSLIERPSAFSLVESGKQYYNAGQFTEAIKALQAAAKTYEEARQTLQQAQVLSFIALAQQKLGQWQRAENAIALGLSLVETVSVKGEQVKVRAQILNAKGHLQLAKGQAEAALKTWQTTEELYQKAGDRTGTLGTLINQATALEILGFYRRACNTVLQGFNLRQDKCETLTVQTLEQVLTNFQKQPKALQVVGLRSLGNVLRLTGQLQESLLVLNQSLAIARQISSSQDESKAWLALGNTQQFLAVKARDLKKTEVAQQLSQTSLKSYRQSAAIAQSSDNFLSLTALQAQLNQLRLLIETQQWSDALSLIPSVRSQLHQLPPSRASVYARVNFAQSLANFKQQQSKNAISWSDIANILKDAVQAAQSTQDKRAQSYALGYLGQLEYQYQLPTTANPETAIAQALILAQTEKAPEIAYRWQWQLGRIYRQRQEIETAIAFYQAAFDTLQVLRGDLITLNQEIQFSFREQVEPIYREFAALLLEPKVGETQPQQKNLLKAREAIEALQLATLDNYFQDACALPKENIESIDPQAAVIYTSFVPQRLEIILSLPDGTLKLHTSQIVQSEVEQTIEQLQLALREPDRLLDVQTRSQQIYHWLIEPFEKDLNSEIKTLVFVLDGALQNVPTAVLYNGKQYLAERYATVVTPGLKLLGPQRQSRSLEALIAGMSEKRQVGQQEFTALKNVEDELKAIQSVVASEALFNATFTTTNLQQEIGTRPFSIVHLATHGQFSSDPDETFILLWDRVLNVKDLNGLFQPGTQLNEIVDLLVLSACETATGDKRASLGLAGVAVRTGARSTLATLWQVNDESTADLMTRFYRNLSEKTGISKAEALRQAQLELWQNTSKDWQVPFFWASYVLVGNWL
jgi:CHAT domain-containing protein/tetratricopeptide (TPR) repeat protein